MPATMTDLVCPMHLGPCDGQSCAWWVDEPWRGCVVVALVRVLERKEVIIRDVELGMDWHHQLHTG